MICGKHSGRIPNVLIAAMLLISFAVSFVMPSGTTLAKYSLSAIYTIAASSNTEFTLTSIDKISGSAQVEQTVSAGAVTPTSAAATLTYQWMVGSSTAGPFTAISGANSASYTIPDSYQGLYLVVQASGNGNFNGSVTSGAFGPIAGLPQTPLSSVGISGSVYIGSTLSADSLTPSGATASYQWLSCSTSNGTYLPISGATSSTYTISSGDSGHYFELQATGTGSYSGTVTGGPVGPVGNVPITGISNIIGNTVVGQTLTAGTVTPAGATVTYQWISVNGNTGAETDIPGATSSTYYISSTQYNNDYFKVRATGTGSFTGTITSAATISKLGTGTTAVTAIGATTGTLQVGQTLTAGTLMPTYAVATYQWYKCSTSGGTYTSIAGATNATYTLTGSDCGYYLKVTAVGSGNYVGTVTNSPVGPVTSGVLTAIGDIVGTAASNQTLTAGTLTPAAATVTYQWQVSSSAYGTYSNISGATSNTYSLGTGNTGNFFKVLATGYGSFSGTATSNIIGPVVSGSATPISAIGSIIGSAVVGQTLYAGDLSPSGASVTYQWMRCGTSGGTYSSISGATSGSYTLTPGDFGYCIEVRATGSGSYSGIATSSPTASVAAYPLTAISEIIGNTCPGKALTAGTVTPLGATVRYQWQYTEDGVNFTDVIGANSSSFTLLNDYNYKYFRVKVDGTGSYIGTVYSNLTAQRVGSTSINLTGMGTITGTAAVGKTLTAGALSPSGASATYQWQRCATSGGSYNIIPGATSGSYTLTADDYGCYIEVVATGSGFYSEALTSAPTSRVTTTAITSIGNIVGTAAQGQTLTAGTISPASATVTYQWQSCATSNGTFTNVSGATGSTYIIGSGDVGNYLRVTVTGTGAYTGAAVSTPTGPVISGSATPITAIGSISGTAQVGQTLTAGAITPSGATVTYQWLRCSTSGGSYTPISGAVSSTYTLTASDFEDYIEVRATGCGTYSGTAISLPTNVAVAACPLTSISNIIGSAYDNNTLIAGTVLPLGATFTYQWQRGDWNYNLSGNISGATSNTFTIDSSYSGSTIRVTVTGTGAYTGTITSAWLPNQIDHGTLTAISSLSGITGTAKVGNTLTSGTVSPSGATLTYQWQRCATANGSYENIPGATNRTYVPISSDLGYYIRVVVTGSGMYGGTLTSSPVGPSTS